MTFWVHNKEKDSEWERDLLAMERQLLDPVTRRSRQDIEALLHDDFVEFGSSGRVYDKETMVSIMSRAPAADVLIRDFGVLALAPEVALVTYRSVVHGGGEVRRSSVWVNEDARWQVVFHQGTKIPTRLKRH